MKGLKIRKDITCSELVSILHERLNIDPYLFDIHIKCCYNLLVQVPPIDIVDDEDLNFFLEGSDASRMPLFVSLTPHERHGVHDIHPECNPTAEAVPNISTYDFPTTSSLEENVEACNLGDDRSEEWAGQSIPTYDVYGQWSIPQTIPTPPVAMPSVQVPPTVPTQPFVDIAGPSNGPSYEDLITVPHDCLNDEDVREGQIFFSKYDLSVKLSILALKKNFGYRVKKSTKSLLTVRCLVEGCKWRVRAKKLEGSDSFKVTKYPSAHTCSLEMRTGNHQQAKSWVIGHLIKSKYDQVGRTYRPRDIIEDVRRDYGVNISYGRAYRAREYALVFARGSPEGSYALVNSYGEALKLANPGTVFEVEVEEQRYFKYVYMAFGPCIRGFLNCIRPVIVVDGTHLHEKYKGMLLIATCIDGNNNIYPIAFGIVDGENDAS